MQSGEYLRLRRGFMVVPDERALHIRCLRRVLLLRGEAATSILPQVLSSLDGSKTVDEIAMASGEPDAVREVVAVLERAGLLEDVRKNQTNLPDSLLAFLDSLGADLPEAVDRLQAQRFGVLASPGLEGYLSSSLHHYGATAVEVLVEAGVSGTGPEGGSLAAQIESLAQRSTFILAALDRWQPPLMDLVNRICVRLGKPFLGVHPQSEVLFLIGPLVVPLETACYACLERRRRSNQLEGSQLNAALDRLAERDPAGPRHLGRSVPPLYESAIALAVTEAVKWSAGLYFYIATLNAAVAFNPFMLKSETMPVLRLPRCPVCSRVTQAPPERVWMGE